MANTITIGDFNSQKENFTVIDVREPDEMAGGKTRWIWKNCQSDCVSAMIYVSQDVLCFIV